MLQIQQYVKASSLEEAYTLLTKNRNNLILGGMMWLKMETRMVPVGIDLCDLGLDQIEENEEGFRIGAMVTLRQIECHNTLHEWTGKVLKDAVKDIVGVQFRNGATIGGSVYSRFGFSDILTALLCLDCEVHLYHGGVMSIEEFVNSPYQRDIITHIFIRKTNKKQTFACVRKSATDISVLNVSLSKDEKEYVICVGARPKKAMRFVLPANMEKEDIVKEVCAQAVCESNMRASKEYREKLVEALVRKVLMKVEEDSHAD